MKWLRNFSKALAPALIVLIVAPLTTFAGRQSGAPLVDNWTVPDGTWNVTGGITATGEVQAGTSQGLRISPNGNTAQINNDTNTASIALPSGAAMVLSFAGANGLRIDDGNSNPMVTVTDLGTTSRFGLPANSEFSISGANTGWRRTAADGAFEIFSETVTAFKFTETGTVSRISAAVDGDTIRFWDGTNTLADIVDNGTTGEVEADQIDAITLIVTNVWRQRSGTTQTIEDSAGNDLVTIVDNSDVARVAFLGGSAELWFGDSNIQIYESGTNDLSFNADGGLRVTLSSAGLLLTGIYAATVQSVSQSGADTLTPSSSYIEINCSNAGGCAQTFSETGAVEGTRITIKNLAASTGAVTVADSAGVQMVAGASISLGDDDIVEFIYDGTAWNQSTAVLAIE